MANALATTQQNAVIDWSPDQVELIKRTVAKGATNDELSMFLHLSRAYGLDPFAKEIWFIKYGGTPTMFTSRDGYLKIANEHPQMDGLVSDVVHANDTFSRTPEGVSHAYGNPRGEIVGAYALIYRKDRSRPVYVFAPFEEYNSAKNGTWRQYPSAMIQKVAESMALKRAFSISGLVTREELDVQRDDDRPVEPRNVTPPKEQPQATAAQRSAPVETPTAAEMIAYGQSKDLDVTEIKTAFWNVTGLESTKGWTPTKEACEAWAKEMDAIAEANAKRQEAEVMGAPEAFAFDDVPQDAPAMAEVQA